MKRSKWFGLWKNDKEHYMTSQPIKIDDLKDFTESDSFRLILKKNKFYEKDGNKPYYNFAIGNCWDSSYKKITSRDMQYDDLEDIKEDLKEMSAEEICDFIQENFDIRLFTYNDVRKVMHEANYDGTQGYTDIIIEDYI